MHRLPPPRRIFAVQNNKGARKQVRKSGTYTSGRPQDSMVYAQVLVEVTDSKDKVKELSWETLEQALLLSMNESDVNNPHTVQITKERKVEMVERKDVTGRKGR